MENVGSIYGIILLSHYLWISVDKGLPSSFCPWSTPHWNSSWLPWLPGYLIMIAWHGLTQNLCLWLPYVYLLRRMRSHTLQSDWSTRHSHSQWWLWGLRHHSVLLYISTWVSGCWGRLWYRVLTPDTSVCLIWGSGDSGAWCFFSWPSDFPSVLFILWLICLFNTPASSIPVWTSIKHFSLQTCSSESSSHFIFRPPSSLWGFLRGLRNLRAST